VFMNGQKVNGIPLYIKGMPHGSFPPSIAPPGSTVSIRASYAPVSCKFFSCIAKNVSNSYAVPTPDSD
jgi:hypothetical protein